MRGVDKESVLQDLLDKVASRKFEERHGDIPIESLGEDIIDDYPPGWLEYRSWLEEEYGSVLREDYWEAMHEAARP